MSRSAADLPEDPVELRRFAVALASEVHAKTLLIEKLRMQLSILRRARFGRSSEKLDREIEQLELLLGDIEESDAERQTRTEASDSEASSILSSKKLADAVQRHGVDHAAAFQEYHDRLRPFVEEVQEKAVGLGMALMFPSNDAEIAERNRKLSEGAIEL